MNRNEFLRDYWREILQTDNLPPEVVEKIIDGLIGEGQYSTEDVEVLETIRWERINGYDGL